MVQGTLEKQSNGRYAIYHELTSGDVVEVYLDGKWVRTSIEYSKDDGYYITNGCPIDGATVRVDGLN
jgi:hypothetical protein